MTPQCAYTRRATAVDHFLSQADNNSSIGVAYFYFDYKTKSTSRDVISSLLKQLCLLRRSIPRTLQQIYEKYREDHISTSSETLKARKGPETGEIFAALLDVASKFDKAYICIDGKAPDLNEPLKLIVARTR
jgi:hypothetical protein